MIQKTRAAVLFDLGSPLELVELTLPELQSGQVSVEVAFSGVCRSQLLEARGLRGADPHLPHTLGHEGSGTVLEVGPGVEKVRVGDRVVLSWIRGKGREVPSVLYSSARGPIHSGAISTFMRYAVTCENRLVKIPPDFPLREAALLGCAVPTGAGMVFHTADVPKGASVAVFGVGGVGLSALWAARFRKANPIVAVDVLEHKLEMAQRLGATHTVHAGRQDPLKVLSEITKGAGVDYAFETAGLRETMETAFRAVRDGGGLCVVAGNLPRGNRISLDPFELIAGKRIAGTWGGESQPDRDIPLYVDWYLSGQLPLSGFITHGYALEQINGALEDLGQGKVGRALIHFDEVRR